MDERHGGPWSVLRLPAVYASVQRAMGSPHLRKELADRYLQIQPGDRLLDIGCGPGVMLDELPPVSYTGFDPSPSYIDAAREKYGLRHILCRPGGQRLRGHLGRYHSVLAKSVLHHVDDETATELFRLSRTVLEAGGRLVTSDPCFQPEQSPIARLLISSDRGRYVRSPEGYEAIARAVFDDVTVHVRHDLLRVPYTHVILVCQA